MLLLGSAEIRVLSSSSGEYFDRLSHSARPSAAASNVSTKPKELPIGCNRLLV